MIKNNLIFTLKALINTLLFLTIFCPLSLVYGQATNAETKDAAKIIGTWLSKSTAHYDFQSATTLNPKRAGTKFFGIPDMQMASDYGISFMSAPRDQDVTEAYKYIGSYNPNMDNALKLSRIHFNFGFDNRHDFCISYLMPQEEEISGWGMGYKRSFKLTPYYYFSYRFNFSRSYKENYFDSTTFMQDVAASIHFILFDGYLGVRQFGGMINFSSNIPSLKIPQTTYLSSIDELEYYIGVIGSTTTNTRATFEASTLGKNYSIVAKLSFHFDSLWPTPNNWFRDPRYIKQ